MILRVQIDGVTSSIETTPRASLMDAIYDGRETPCRDGSCLRCLVLLGDRVVPACNVPAYRAQGVPVTTPSGIDSRPEYRDILRAFRKAGLDRCVETEPYLVMLAMHILATDDMPDDDALHRLSRHLNDRCSNREDFERAVRIAAGLRRRRLHE